MSEVNLIKYETRESWLAARTLSLGASESAALFGLAPDSRESEYSLWAKKAGLVEPEQIDSEWLEWGQILEQPIAERYAKRTGAVLWQPPTPWCVAVHPRLTFLTATIDRWIVNPGQDRGDLEIKNVGAFNADWKGEGGAIAIPLHIQAQVQHQLAVTGFSYAVVAALIGGNKLETFEVARNQDFIDELEAKAEEFWGKVQRKEAPPADGSEATSKVLKRLHPDDDGSTIALDDEAETLTAQWETAKADKSAAEANEKEAKNRLIAKVGAATFGQLPGGRILSLKTTARSGYYVDDTKFRTLRIEKPKAAKKGSK